ncbi:Ig domain-containing protein [Ruixingdingia sedimenti]|uniref:Ig domain-containing protein n=1 Tax=Ruixingdingia sedimenti TaxID=3073604 RepID=A0ABU1FDC2_9RHOB|nr:Ig domain-containing protein [Xinfangfangia sp. LG-4]MDR5654882.1 Ig domain-containing protein [Xinfangfangia sp. LG-4]
MTQFPWKITRGGQEIYFPEGSRRFVSVSVEQIAGDGRLDRAIDGSAIWLGDAAFRRHAVTLSCQGHTTAPVFDVWPGQVVTLEAPVEFAVAGPSATLAYDPVAGSVYGVDADDNRLPGTTVAGRVVSCPGAVALRYRPVMQCVVASRNADKTQNRADAGWTIRLEDLSGAETGIGEDGDTITFAAPGLQNYTAGEAFSLSLSGSVTSSTGLPITFDIVSGALPAGLTMNSAGVISGTPTAHGVSVAVVRAQSGGVAATQTVPFYDALPTITSNGISLQEYAVDTAYSLDLNTLVDVTGTDEEPVFALVSGSVPTGLSLADGVLSGTPTSFGAVAATFSATLPTGQSTELTVAFFLQNPDFYPDAVILGGTAQTWVDSAAFLNTTYDACDFTASGVLTVLQAGWVEYIIVGGGGGGGSVSSTAGGGGGSAGGFRRERIYLPVGTYTVTIGGGGGPGAAGSITSFGAVGLTGANIFGGTRGGTTSQAGVGSSGSSGSGGGGSATAGGAGGVASASDYGSNGGAGNTSSTAASQNGGGGGGFSEAGLPGSNGRGHGGGGVKVRLWETLVFCGGGGGGAGNGGSNNGAGGAGGGGNGGSSNASGASAAANTGGGGGGAGGGPSGSRTGGQGGSGRAIFIVKRRTAS